jgi:hypothetical protein
MLAILRRQLPADDDRYGWEFTWDGLRAIAYVNGKRVRLLSRNDNDMTGSYPELAVLTERVQVPVILDGEIVALHEGRPDFGVLQSRMHVRRPRARLIDSVPVQLYVFDLLYRGEDSLLGLPYTERRARLEDLGLDADPVRTPPWYRDDAQAVQAVSLQHGLEGVVGKPLASRYQPGRRRDWIKIKNGRHPGLKRGLLAEDDMRVGGVRPARAPVAEPVEQDLPGEVVERANAAADGEPPVTELNVVEAQFADGLGAGRVNRCKNEGQPGCGRGRGRHAVADLFRLQREDNAVVLAAGPDAGGRVTEDGSGLLAMPE